MKKSKFFRKSRSFKPSVKNMVKELYDQIIPALQSPAQAEAVETDLFRSMQGGLISQEQYLSYRSQIREVYEENGWIQPCD